MGEEMRTWTLLGRTLSVKGAPETLHLLEALLHEIETRGRSFRHARPDADETTYWLMGLLSLLENMAVLIQEYENFCTRIEHIISKGQSL